MVDMLAYCGVNPHRLEKRMTEQDTEPVRRATQLQHVIDALRDTGRADAHLLLMQHGITRAATYIHGLRKAWGADSIETTREHGEMAVYLLKVPPTHWFIPSKPRRASWTCVDCGATAPTGLTIEQRTPRMGRGECPTCAGSRMFRR